MASPNMSGPPSSPLSSVPSDFDLSQPPTPIKRKAAESETTNGRSSRRRKTEDTLKASLDQIKIEIISKAQASRSATPVPVVHKRPTAKPATEVSSKSAAKKTWGTRKSARSSTAIETLEATIESDPSGETSELYPEALSIVGVNDAVHALVTDEVNRDFTAAPIEVDEGPVDPEQTLFNNPTPGYTLMQLENQLESEPSSRSPPHKTVEDSEPGPEMTTSSPVASGIKESRPPQNHENELPKFQVKEDTEIVQDQPVESDRPTRRRVQPTKLDDGFVVEEVKAVASTKRKGQPLRGNWSVNHLLSNPKSKLATCGLNELLSHPTAWSILDRSQQLELISMLPASLRPEVPDLPEDIELPNYIRQELKRNNAFQADVRLFQEDLAAGRYEPKWLEDAQAAMEKRGQGHFDDWKEKNREEFWGQKQKVDWTALSSDSAQHTLTDLAVAGLFEVGDIWTLKRAQGHTKNRIEVEKEAKIISIASDGALAFTFPPDQHKFSSPINGNDVTLQDVRNPKALTDAIINEDGRLVGIRGANAWKDFRCHRKAQDMGALWDVRELYHQRQSA